MVFHVLTIFPEFFRGPFEHGVVARAIESGKIQIALHDLRGWTSDRHKTVDDRPFGGGEGMLLKAEPVFLAAESIFPERRLGEAAEVLLICGRYEGVDERVAEHLADEELSIGDYVLSGGELAAAVVIDAVARLLPGVLGNEDSAVRESFSGGADRPGILDCPQYTRPADFRSWKAPEVLLGGNHEEIRRWRLEAALSKTARLRPELLERLREKRHE